MFVDCCVVCDWIGLSLAAPSTISNFSVLTGAAVAVHQTFRQMEPTAASLVTLVHTAAVQQLPPGIYTLYIYVHTYEGYDIIRVWTKQSTRLSYIYLDYVEKML